VIELIRAAAELQSVCEAQQWRFCFIGGLALQRWGEPRETVDVDLTLLTGFGGEKPFIEVLLNHFKARIEGAAQFALTRRVLLLRAPSGVGLDIALGGLPFEENAVARSSKFAYPGEALIRTCSAEDLIVMKAFAARPKDWIDIEGIIIRQTGQLDWNYIGSQLKPLAELKGEPEILADLEKRRIEFEREV
jgi:Nucleotidyl transferase AbiEii toxin, Type IV TA system